MIKFKLNIYLCLLNCQGYGIEIVDDLELFLLLFPQLNSENLNIRFTK